MLCQAGHKVRAAVRDTAKAGSLAGLGAEVIAADLDRPESLPPALAGTEKALLSTAADARQVEQHGAFIRAARTAGLKHMVRISAVGADTDSPMQICRMHATSERDMEQSGIAWSHLRPQSFMQNFFAFVATVAGQGKIYACAGRGKISFVDLRDIAALAVAALTQPGHEGKIYDVTGPEALSYEQAADKLSAITKKKIEYVDIPPEAAVQGMTGMGLPDWLARDLAAMSQLYAKGYEAEVSAHVRQVTGRDATSFDRFLADHAAIFRG
jgi:uncharacterized protein YbjT (DUF2867 family)